MWGALLAGEGRKAKKLFIRRYGGKWGPAGLEMDFEVNEGNFARKKVGKS